RYYAEIGMSQEYNAPSFTRFSDSLGNVNHPTSTEFILDSRNKPLRPGVVLRLEVEVDAHYHPSEYFVAWRVMVPGLPQTTGTSLILPLEPKHVGELFAITAQAISRKEWHRHGTYDAQIRIMYRVLPPV